MVEVSLDDLIAQHKKQNRSGNNRGAFRGFGRFRGRGRRFINRRSTPYFASGLTRMADRNWNHDKFLGNYNSQSDCTILNVCNLDPQVNDADMRELFETIGPLKSAHVHYNAEGKSLCTAEVVFLRKGDPLKAISQFSNMKLDGRLLKMSVFGEEPRAPLSQRIFDGVKTNRSFPFVGRRDYYQHDQRGNFPVNNSTPRGRRWRRGGRSMNSSKTVEELNAELESYMEVVPVPGA
ncbi:uncharacterized protein LOC135121983 [Zophobas morio]|uniref:uncharacterized protein LOC135121983 n=1 Tax=Zophobas morio TaxID=2755281 RepID=UPI003083BF8E